MPKFLHCKLNLPIDEVLDFFEKTAWPGLEQDRYVWSAIMHEKDGRVDVHVYAARVDIETGKSLNITPPGWHNTFNLLCEHFNYKYGWARPDDLSRRRALSPGNYFQLDARKLKDGMAHEDPRQVIHKYIEAKIIQGQITERSEIIQDLIECGLEIPRQGKDYITVKDPDTQEKYRMKGVYYEREFNVSNFAKAEAEERRRDQTDRGIDPEKSEIAWNKLQEKIEKRAEYNRKNYPGPKPENRKMPGTDTQAGNKDEKFNKISVDEIFPDLGDSLFVHLQRSLGNDSLLQEYHTEIEFDSTGIDQGGSISGEFEEVENDRNRTETFRILEELQQGMGRIFNNAKQADKGLARACSQLEQTTSVLENQDRRLDEVKIKMDRELEEFKARNLVEIAECCGYEIDHDRSTRSAISMRAGEHKIVVGQGEDGHGIYFTVDGQQEQASVIDFVQNRLAASGQPSNLGYVRKELRNNNFSFSCRPSVSRASKIKPEKSSKNRVKVEAEIQSWDAVVSHPYLEDRGLDQVLSDPCFKDCVLSDDRKNVCFPQSDSQGLCGAELKNRDFTGQIKNGTKGLWVSNFFRNDERLVVCESAIDCLSYHLLHGDSRTRYVSFGGALSDRQRSLLQGLMRKAHDNGQDIVIAVDQDSQGDKYEEELRSLAPVNVRMNRHVPISKDFNDDLRSRLDRVDSTDWEHGFELNV
ncbi:MAG: toprim domain-containing protein [Bacteroidota bacterium]